MVLDFNLSISEPFKMTMDATALGTSLGVILAILPSVSVLLSTVWVIWRLYNEYLITKKLTKEE